MAATFSTAKLAVFALSNLVGGLLQVWVLYVALASVGKQHNIPILLGDGGLFFFSTSLTVNSILILLGESPGKLSSSDLLTTAAAVVGGFMSITVYVAVLTSRLGTIAPFHDHIGAQIVCAILSLSYAFFVAVRTGYFSK